MKDEKHDNALLAAYEAGYQEGCRRIAAGVDVAGSGDEYLRYIGMLRSNDDLIRERAFGFTAAIREHNWFLKSMAGSEA